MPLRTPPLSGVRAAVAALESAGLEVALGGSGLLAAHGLVERVERLGPDDRRAGRRRSSRRWSPGEIPVFAARDGAPDEAPHASRALLLPPRLRRPHRRLRPAGLRRDPHPPPDPHHRPLEQPPPRRPHGLAPGLHLLGLPDRADLAATPLTLGTRAPPRAHATPRSAATPLQHCAAPRDEAPLSLWLRIVANRPGTATGRVLRRQPSGIGHRGARLAVAGNTIACGRGSR